MDMKQFDKTIASIKKAGAKMDEELHSAACFALEQINMHGNNGPVNKLLGAFNKSSRKEAMYTWFNDFGMGRRDKDGTINYAAKKKINHEGVELSPADALEVAASIPFYDYTKEITPASSYDVMKGIMSILNKAKSAQGKGMAVEHAELLEKLAAFVPATE